VALVEQVVTRATEVMDQSREWELVQVVRVVQQQFRVLVTLHMLEDLLDGYKQGPLRHHSQQEM
jgi:hypothetical protein